LQIPAAVLGALMPGSHEASSASSAQERASATAGPAGAASALEALPPTKSCSLKETGVCLHLYMEKNCPRNIEKWVLSPGPSGTKHAAGGQRRRDVLHLHFLSVPQVEIVSVAVRPGHLPSVCSRLELALLCILGGLVWRI